MERPPGIAAQRGRDGRVGTTFARPRPSHFLKPAYNDANGSLIHILTSIHAPLKLKPATPLAPPHVIVYPNNIASISAAFGKHRHQPGLCYIEDPTSFDVKNCPRRRLPASSESRRLRPFGRTDLQLRVAEESAISWKTSTVEPRNRPAHRKSRAGPPLHRAAGGGLRTAAASNQ